ncbi:hypothetical protein [Sphingomonas sp. VNH70]|uniref:hypothetical protein n=1 Tax=Sphingomonas silueang TaxID=3156617 RepID=UPI0032B53C18
MSAQEQRARLVREALVVLATETEDLHEAAALTYLATKSPSATLARLARMLA